MHTTSESQRSCRQPFYRTDHTSLKLLAIFVESLNLKDILEQYALVHGEYVVVDLLLKRVRNLLEGRKRLQKDPDQGEQPVEIDAQVTPRLL
jgi:hypothetical protein